MLHFVQPTINKTLKNFGDDFSDFEKKNCVVELNIKDLLKGGSMSLYEVCGAHMHEVPRPLHYGGWSRP
jgi:hypothetical protein